MEFEPDKEVFDSNFFSEDISKSNKFKSELFKINSVENNYRNSFQLSYTISQGELLNGARKIEKFNFIGYIGGPNQGALQFNINVPYSCLYFLSIKYIAYDINLKFKVSANNIITDLIYSPKYFSELTTLKNYTFTLPIVLNEGNNIIKFYGDRTDFAPYLGDFTLTLPPIVNILNKGIIEGDAYIDPNMNFVSAIGGPNDNGITAAINVTTKGMYNLTFQYDSPDKIRPLKIDINGFNNGEEYILPLTNEGNIKTFSILISLNMGINTIRFHGDGINYGPSLGAFMVSFSPNISTSVFATETKTYNITSGTVGNGAIIDKKLNMVTNIGGTIDGFYSITIPIDSYGKYLMKINYNNNNRPLKIDINDIDTGTIYMVMGKKRDIFSITIPLVVGINTLKFHGDGKNTSPDLGSFTLTLIENNFNNDFNGDLLYGAKFLLSGVIGGLGGTNDGKYIMEYVASQAGKYILNISLDTSKGNILLIDINGENTGFNYTMPKSNKVIVYKVTLSLKEGINEITFHGNYIDFAPNILKIEVKLAYASKESIYKLSDGDLQNGAEIDADTNFIEGIGGIDNGNVTIKVNAEADGSYDLNVNYIENEIDTPLKIDVNNTTIDGVLLCSDLEDASYFQKFNTTISLKKGSNSIKFYGNEIDKVSKLGDITIKQSSEKKFSNFTQTYELDKGTLSEDFKKIIWSDEEGIILGNGAVFLKSDYVYIINIGGSNRGGAIIDINIPKSDDYILTLNYGTTESNKKLLVDFNYVNNPQIVTFEKTNGVNKKDIKTIQVKAPLVLGKNTIILSGDGINFAPILGGFTISQANKNTEAYKIVSKELKSGAKEVQNGNYITALGGKNKGYVLLTINVTLKGQYDLAFKYTAPEEKRSLKIKINKKLDNIYMLPITDNGETLSISSSFTIPLNLIAGSNTVEIKGNGNILTPNIGRFTLALSSINSVIRYNIAFGVLKNGARVNEKGLVCNIGGPKQGEVSLKVTVPFKGVYDFHIDYEAINKDEFLEILVNDISAIKRNTFVKNVSDSTVDFLKLKLRINLDEGNNIIKFRGKKEVYAPRLGNLILRITFTNKKNLSSNSFDISKGLLQNGAGIEYDTGLVVNLGGRLNGSVTSTVDSLAAGDYSMILKYRAKNTPAPILIDINGEEDGNIYILDETGEEIGQKTFIINLKKGKNTIKFYGDKNDDAPDLDTFSLTPLFKLL